MPAVFDQEDSIGFRRPSHSRAATMGPKAGSPTRVHRQESFATHRMEMLKLQGVMKPRTTLGQKLASFESYLKTLLNNKGGSKLTPKQRKSVRFLLKTGSKENIFAHTRIQGKSGYTLRFDNKPFVETVVDLFLTKDPKEFIRLPSIQESSAVASSEFASTITSPPSPLPPSSTENSVTNSKHEKAVYPISHASIDSSTEISLTQLPVASSESLAKFSGKAQSVGDLLKQNSNPEINEEPPTWPQKYSSERSPSSARRSRSKSRARPVRHEGWKAFPELVYKPKSRAKASRV